MFGTKKGLIFLLARENVPLPCPASSSDLMVVVQTTGGGLLNQHLTSYYYQQPIKLHTESKYNFL